MGWIIIIVFFYIAYGYSTQRRLKWLEEEVKILKGEKDRNELEINQTD